MGLRLAAPTSPIEMKEGYGELQLAPTLPGAPAAPKVGQWLNPDEVSKLEQLQKDSNQYYDDGFQGALYRAFNNAPRYNGIKLEPPGSGGLYTPEYFLEQEKNRKQ